MAADLLDGIRGRLSGALGTDSKHVAAGMRPEHQLLDRAEKPHFAPVEHQHLIREPPDLLQPLGGPDDRGAVGRRAAHQLPHPPRRHRIEIVGGLVHQQHRRIEQQCAGNRQPLLHAVRVRVDAAAGGLFQPDVGQPGLRPTPRLTARQAVQAAEEDEILDARDPQVEGTVAGGHESDPPPGLERIGRDVDACHVRGAAAGGDQAGEDPKQGRLAGAVRAQQRANAAGVDLEVDAGERKLFAERTAH